VTVTSTVATPETLDMARELARGRAAQGLRTVLVNADLHAPDAFGFGEALLDETLDLDAILRTTDTQLSEMSSGRVSGTPFTTVTAPRVAALLARLTEEFDFVVVAAPPITDAAESQILCAAGDGVLLVVDASKSRTTDIAEASALLTSFGARLIGSVLSGTSRARGFTSRAGKPATAAPRSDQLIAARTPAYAAAHSDARDQ
jgi:Mrp family chromosome partitioning ATPase